jgi:hypothetical protein
MRDFLRDPSGRFRGPTPTEAAGDLSWLDKALAPSRKRARAVDGPAADPAPPAPEPPEPAPAPGPPSPPAIPAGPRDTAPTGDLIRDAMLRRRR